MTANEAVTGEPITKAPGVLGGAACIGALRSNRGYGLRWVSPTAGVQRCANCSNAYHPPLTAPELAAARNDAEQHGEEIEANIRDNQDD